MTTGLGARGSESERARRPGAVGPQLHLGQPDLGQEDLISNSHAPFEPVAMKARVRAAEDGGSQDDEIRRGRSDEPRRQRLVMRRRERLPSASAIEWALHQEDRI